ncbi:MAG: helix-turn-helix transcriptional regulator [Actinomycetota bacterium]
MSTSGEDRSGSVFPGFSDIAEDPIELIDRLSELRRSRGLSQTEVAARMGTSQSALARLESGQTDVRVSTLARYAAALDADIGFAVRGRGGQ